ncbi:aspartic peptidase domain-containing protein [Pisolithus orientalis]|uniref:aspartic peptidase domain-containing protein n=1 Tax=Pisolithus orientalis TaxID=936130 RepID=UPI002224C919|nr:aspartic peptidase domain-containing protein [Pisolithus orientalis]KAI6015051.1 aspartic peptidase domain-containing protein [Pisolithus orientalis]
MFPVASLLTTVLLALSTAASPVEIRSPLITLPFARSLNTRGGTVNLLQHDQVRATALRDRGNAIAAGRLDRRQSNMPITTFEAAGYIAAVGVGSPATTYNLIVDTGSSNTWVGAGTPYKVTNTSVDTGEPVYVPYGSGSFSGTEYTDTVTLGSLTITKQSIGVASTSTDFSGVDGVLGIGPEDLTLGSLTNEPSTEIPTVTQNLYTEGKIPAEIVGVSFEPSTTTSSMNGELTFGGIDTSKYNGVLTYTPLTTTSPASYYWGINESITYGWTTILSTTAGIVDTGTTLILIATDAFNQYQSLTGAVSDSATGMLRITTSQYSALQNLYFNINGVTYTLTPNGQIWPRSLNTYIGGSSSYVYLIVNDIGSNSGSGLDFVNGKGFLERFYSVFDTTNSRVGLATTSYTYAIIN